MSERQEMRICPGCTGWIEARAVTCRHCGHKQNISTPESRALAKRGASPAESTASAKPPMSLGVEAAILITVISLPLGTGLLLYGDLLWAWCVLGFASTAISWLLLRSAILSALRQNRREQQS